MKSTPTPAKVKVKARKCACGCGGMTKGGRFCQGHDAILKSRLHKRAIKDGVRGHQAVATLQKLGWPMPKALALQPA